MRRKKYSELCFFTRVRHGAAGYCLRQIGRAAVLSGLFLSAAAALGKRPCPVLDPGFQSTLPNQDVILLGLEAYSQQHYVAALELFHRARNLNPQPELVCYLADSYCALHRYKDADRWFAEFASLTPDEEPARRCQRQPIYKQPILWGVLGGVLAATGIAIGLGVGLRDTSLLGPLR